MINHAELLTRWQSIQMKILEACVHAKRLPSSVGLLAVSKTFPASMVACLAAAGQEDFGENYVQEAIEKMDALLNSTTQMSATQIRWHFIGPIQRNKTKVIAERFDWVHTVDRLLIAERLSAQRPTSLPPLNVCIQVNISEEPSKHGITPLAVLPLAKAIAKLPNIQLRGLMSIPEHSEDYATQLASHQMLHSLLMELQQHGLAVDTLSMGMSADMSAAIHAGSTMVRVGSAIFGVRS